jgi:replication factor C subunit 1
MDIRNFFAAKSPSESKKKVAPASSSNDSDKKKPDKKSSSNAASKASSSSKSTSAKKENSKNDEKAVAASSKKRKIIVESDEDTDNEVMEVSPEDYFKQSKKSSVKKEMKASSPAKKHKTSPKNQKKRIRDDDSDSDDDFRVSDHEDEDFKDFDDEEEDVKPRKKSPIRPKKSPMKSESPTKASPAKKPRKSPVKASPKAKKENIEVLEASLEKDSFDVDNVRVPEFLQGLTFVFTGVMDKVNRDDASDLIKILGGRVTSAVSGKTSYLVVGEKLEDGRDYTEGSKYRKAAGELKDKVKLVMGEKHLYGLCHLYHQKAMKEKGIDPEQANVKNEVKLPSPPTTANPYAKPAPSNPCAKKPASNPYAKPASNPYAKKPASVGGNPYAKANSYVKGTSSAASFPPKTAEVNNSNPNNDLWVDRYKPTNTRDILGNKTNVTKLQIWLKTWEKTFLNSKATGKTFSNPKGPWKAALLSGPPGIGSKYCDHFVLIRLRSFGVISHVHFCAIALFVQPIETTTATLVSKEDGREVMEFNASDARSKKSLQSTLGEITESQGIPFLNNARKEVKKADKRVVIMDEVDGMGAGDRSGMAELIQMIKKSKVPIICICNDRQSQKIKSLLPYCMDLRFSRPTKNILANRAIRIAEQENLCVERNAAEAIAESCGNDVRQVLNLLQMWSQKKSDDGSQQNLTYRSLKERERAINKDEILRVSLFDAAKLIMEGRTGLQQADSKANVDSFMKRNDAFFVDYSITGLLVEQNFPKIMQSQYLRQKQNQDPHEEQQLLERMYKASESMSDYNLIENEIRGGDQNWSLLPTSAMLTVKCGYHAGGENGGFLPGFPEFTAWMGKNSTTNKNFRLLSELNHHMNYKVSANALELRQTYIPMLRDRIMKLLKKSDEESLKEAIALMDEYGLNREDIAEKMDAFLLGKKDDSFDKLDSKQKAAFTREYNAGSHRQQALVHEQGGGPIKRKKQGAKEKEAVDLDAIDEDDVEDEDSDVDEEAELKKLQEKFKRKRGRGKAGDAQKAAKTTKGKKKK